MASPLTAGHGQAMTSCSCHPAPWRRIRVAIGVAATMASLGLIAAGCAGEHVASPTPGLASHGTSARPVHPVPGAGTSGLAGSPTPAPAPAASGTATPAGPVFEASTSALTAAMRARMTGVSWRRGCPVSLDRLRLLRLSYWGFDHRAHQGELVVNGSAAADLSHAFGLLFAARFPIKQMRVVDEFGGDDERSMLADNTSAFNCRLVPGTNVWSQHAYGLAVDVNPFENPEVSDGNVDPPAAAAWADRSRSSPAAISESDAAWRAFDAIGWTWGGDWQSPKDYMHFSANGL